MVGSLYREAFLPRETAGGQLFATAGLDVRLGGTWARDASLLFLTGMTRGGFRSGTDLRNQVEGLDGDGSRWN